MPAEVEGTGPRLTVGTFARLRTEGPGLVLLSLALLCNAVRLPGEGRVNAVPLNDDAFHAVATERLGEAIAAGEPFLDPWVAEWGLGFPVWRSYQPIPHLVAAPFVHTAPPARRIAVFAVVAAIVRGLLPVAVWAGARLFGLSPLASGLAALLALLPSGSAALGHFGLGADSYAFSGPGLYTQQFAFLLLPLALGAARRALDTGRRRLLSAALLAATLLSHLVVGYVGALAVVLLALVGPQGERPRRLARLLWVAAGSILLTAWFTVPLFLARDSISHSRWEPAWKWDSLGPRAILEGLFHGTLLDSGRLPLLTSFLALSVAAAIVFRRNDTARRLLALTAVLFALFLGRETWGHLLLLLGVPGDLHLHRVQAAFELIACLLIAWSAEATLTALRKESPWAVAPGAAVFGALLLAGLVSRDALFRESTGMGVESLKGWDREKQDLQAAFDDVRRLLAERPGRMGAGPAGGWGRSFQIGSVPVYFVAGFERLDSVSFLFHSMSKAGDLMYQRNFEDAGHDALFGIRAVVAPSGHPVPAHYREVGRHGRFVVYEASGAGYFGLGDVIARYTGERGTEQELSTAWLGSPASRQGSFVALSGGSAELPAVGRWEAIPGAPPSAFAPRGQVVSESAGAGRWQARVRLERPGWAVLKVTWFPGLRFQVDGSEVRPLQVTPGFPAVPVPAGSHVVDAVYRPSPLKPILFVGGVGAFALLGLASRAGRAARVDERLARLASGIETRLGTAVPASAVAVSALVVLSGRALLRGRLIDGHDAVCYPPRIVEFVRAVLDGHLPVVWAADLGNGFGQPLFAFAPPLIYLAALPFDLAGLGLADALQLGLLALMAAGAAGVYTLSRELSVSRLAAVGATAFWLFSPYLHADLLVRAAQAESAALLVSPLVLLALWRLMGPGDPARRLAGGAFAVAAVVLGHNAAALLLVPAFLLVPAVALAERPFRPAPSLRATAALALGLALAAFFWAPAIDELRSVKLTADTFPFRDHFPTYGQLLYSPWGFGLSVAGPDDGMSFMVGPLQLLAGLTGLLAALRGGSGRVRAFGIAAAAASGIGIFLASPASRFLWERISVLQFVQLPWRALVLPTLFLAPLAALALDRIPRPAAIGAVGLVLLANLAHTEPKGYLRFDDEFYEPARIAANGINTTTREEYEPRGVASRPPYSMSPLLAETGIDVVDARETTASRRYVVRVPRPTTVEAAVFWYPGWRVSVDGREVPTTVVPGRGTISFPVEEGEHRIDLDFRRTPVRRAALLVSALVGLLLSAAVVLERRRTPSTRSLRAAVVGLGVCVLLALAIPWRERGGRQALGRIGRPLPPGSSTTAAPAPVDSIAASAAAAEAVMRKGLDLLYAKRDPRAAAVEFRTVLVLNPTHYGATYQLAIALEQTGGQAEARMLWEKVLSMATGYRDEETARTARIRLEQSRQRPVSP